MVKRLKHKFIFLSGTAIFALLALIVSVVNVFNFSSVVRRADRSLEHFSRQIEKPLPPTEESDQPPGISQSMHFGERYFFFIFSESGEVIDGAVDDTGAIDRETAENYARAAMKDGDESGFIGSYRYLATPLEGGVVISVLDCKQELDMQSAFITINISISLVAFVLVMLIIVVISERIIQPISESYEKQKRFITDAGHEIKTPLAIINANADLLLMDDEGSEYATEIKQQAGRLRALTDKLVYLSRLSEAENLVCAELPLSETVESSAAPFEALARSRGVGFSLDIAPLISMVGNLNAIEQLISILVENAVKYTPDGGKISISLSRVGHGACLTVTNDVTERISEEDIKHIFDRFYRVDKSRNSALGGHGIGLSVAHAIVESHGGKISAESENGCFSICVTLPLK